MPALRLAVDAAHRPRQGEAMKTAEEMAMEYLGTDPRKRTGETLASLLLLYDAQVREEAAKIADKAESANLQGLDIDTSPEAIAAAIRKMELP